MKKSIQSPEKRARLLFGLVLFVLIIIAALAYYILEKHEAPLRVGFSTGGGGVVFDHRAHTLLKIKEKEVTCQTCHHNYEAGRESRQQDRPGKANRVAAKRMRCRSCHYSRNPKIAGICADAPVHKRCIGQNCQACHLPDPSKNSVSCEFCHNAESFAAVQVPKQVEFVTDAGPVVFNHFFHVSDDGCAIDCDTCHHGYDLAKKKKSFSMGRTFAMRCRRCHYNTFYESICADADVHSRCIGGHCTGCHEDGKENCTFCHKEEQ